MWQSIIFVIAGLALVLLFAGRLVGGTVGFARGFGVVVSVVFLGFDPENLAVGAVGAYEGAEGIALGTIVGSAMVAIALAFGITALIIPLRFEQAPRRILAVPIAAVLLLSGLSFDGRLSRSDGLILLAGYAAAVLYLIWLSRRGVDIRGVGLGKKVPEAVDPGALNSAAALFREFGENYHERTLEEQYVFPPLQNAGGEIAAVVDVLKQQHQRGREITDYILAVSGRGRIGAADAEPFADTLEGMVRMYESHAAREDTIVFPAWKEKVPQSRLQELAEMFEEIEHKQFGEAGFEAAVQHIAGVEATLGLADLARFTAPPPPGG